MLVLALGLAAAAAVAAIGRLTGVRLDPPGLPSATWEGLVTALALAIGAFLAGRAAVRATTARSRRRTRSIALGWSVVGATVLAVWLLFVFRSTLDWIVVAVELLVPVAFVAAAVVGARLSAPRHGRVLLVAFTITSLAVLAGLLMAGGAVSTGLQAVGGGPYASMDELWDAQGFDPLGRPTPTSMQGVFGDQSLGQSNGVATLSAVVTDAGALRGWTGLALEAWCAEPQTMAVLPGETGPFASSLAHLEGGRIEGVGPRRRRPGRGHVRRGAGRCRPGRRALRTGRTERAADPLRGHDLGLAHGRRVRVAPGGLTRVRIRLTTEQSIYQGRAEGCAWSRVCSLSEPAQPMASERPGVAGVVGPLLGWHLDVILLI